MLSKDETTSALEGFVARALSAYHTVVVTDLSAFHEYSLRGVFRAKMPLMFEYKEVACLWKAWKGQHLCMLCKSTAPFDCVVTKCILGCFIIKYLIVLQLNETYLNKM